ncbi:restriction endonuclease [Mycobacterium sp. TNTM28]|uniref:Restriction endonuclease n=1 Tax=[Mycobacterium] fortunisiensis TaxID=2600579 RepID=A0ABS6KL09_9MYCO|nr:restriction endonuclease [[Mycobacterium] fortunisiensis]MBU9763971.1 restriction endonuclease [[Mycobacterium] fortunisiensis]
MGRLRIKLCAAAGVAAGLAAHLAGVDARWCVAIAVVAPLALVGTPRFVLAVFRGLSIPTAGESAATEMTGLEFEDRVAHVARTAGLPVIMTPLTGDWGVDLIVGHRPNRIAVQCKRLSRPVGAAAVQEVVAGAPMQDCTKTMVVTNNEFTPAAHKLAELHGCRLIAGADLPRLKSILRQEVAAPPSRPAER